MISALQSKENDKDQESINQLQHMTQDTTWESDKTQENITYKNANRLALFQQVTTTLQGTDKTVWQPQNRNYKKGQYFLLEGHVNNLVSLGPNRQLL